MHEMFTKVFYMRLLLLTASALSLALIFGTMATKRGEPAKKIRPSFSGATSWLNTQPLTLAGLRGKVVLIDFWTFTCINWRRTLPFIREWSLKYKDQGLVVIGVHTPEFAFEYKLENVTKAVKEMNMEYP